MAIEDDLSAAGVPYPLAAEILNGVRTGSTTAQALVGVGLPAPAARELALQINTKTGVAHTLTASGFPPNASSIIRNFINSGGGALVRRMSGTLNDLPNSTRGSNGTNTTANFRIYRYTKDAQANPSMAFAGFKTAAGVENNIENSITYDNLYFELPSGTMVPVSDVTVAGGTILAESSRASITIPAGTGYWLRGRVNVASGGKYYYTDRGNNATIGSGFEEGVGLAARTTAGAFTSATGNIPGPVGVMADMPAGGRLFGLVGDSISQGVGGYSKPLAGTLGAAPGGDAGYMAGYVSGKFDYLHLGRSGAGAIAERTNYAKRAAFMFAVGVTDVWCNLGINDLNGSNLAATNTRNAIATLFGVLKGTGTTVLRIYQSTITPGTTITGPPSTSTNQTVLTNLQDGRRAAFNDFVRQITIAGQDGFVEAAIPAQNATTPDYWGDGYSSDGLHPLQAGGAAIVAGLTAPF